MTDITPKDVIERYRLAKERRSVWESHWQRPFRNQPEWPFSFWRFGIGYPDSFKFLSRLMPLLLFSGDTPGLAASPGAS